MKRLTTVLCTALLLLSSCGNQAEKLAGEKLAVAQAAFERGDFEEAKRQIDSLKILYPKAFEARKASQELLMQVELQAKGNTLEHLDSLMQTKVDAFNRIKAHYVFEKDTAYQSMGNYLSPSQVVEKNLHRSYLRFQVDEHGVMSMTSIYCGKTNLHHTAVKVVAPDKSFAETPPSKDCYETTDLGEKIEKADYQRGEDGGVINFLYAHKNQNIRVEFKGDKNYVTTMSVADRRALGELYQLADILYAIQTIQKEKDEALLKINFIHKKRAHDTQKKQAEK
ncbi:MAG: hypothetical protein EOM31_06880 [Bacteroidia bacterium]|nr:hypothetical protein [Bacteroidia bacterium]